MKIKLYALVFVVLSHNIHTEDNQALNKKLELLCAPVDTTGTGFKLFLQNTYNEPEYANDVLPNNFCHMAQFLAHGKKTKQSRGYVQSVIRLFTNKIKGSEYVNADAFDEILTLLPSLVGEQFLIQRLSATNLLQEKINNLFYARFKEKFSMFQDNPTAFFNELTQEILETLGTESLTLGEASIEELRKTTLIFLETCLSKLIWSPENARDSWRSIKDISESLAALVDCNIITDPEDLNGLFITLVERYCFFVKVAHVDFSGQLYNDIKHDIDSAALLLLELEEQEPFIMCKKDRLKSAIDTALREKSNY